MKPTRCEERGAPEAAILRREVSIHAPTRGATCARPSKSSGQQKFQSTRPRGARRHVKHSRHHNGSVSIHAPTRGATKGGALSRISRVCFNPRAHAGRDSPARRENYLLRQFQSTRPRGARHINPDPGTSWHVSIHAPTRGATSDAPMQRILSKCFNPRAHAGRDAPPPGDTSARPRFNPRAHAGRDPPDDIIENPADPVSIHAPTRGATIQPPCTPSRYMVFQSTRPRGARREAVRAMATEKVFQSTRPRGARPTSCAPWSSTTSAFQSTRPRGARRHRPQPGRASQPFQSTRPRGARRVQPPGAGI